MVSFATVYTVACQPSDDVIRKSVCQLQTVLRCSRGMQFLQELHLFSAEDALRLAYNDEGSFESNKPLLLNMNSSILLFKE